MPWQTVEKIPILPGATVGEADGRISVYHKRYISNLLPLMPPKSEEGTMFRFPGSRRFAISRLLVIALAYTVFAGLPAGYKGYPYLDVIQEIPGRVDFMRFDQGKAGTTGGSAVLDVGTKEVTWHDYMDVGRWYCHDLRATTGPSLQKMGAGGDHMGDGWTGTNYTNNQDCYLADANTGDWTKYTVNVKKSGVYSMDIMEAADPDPQYGGPYVNLSFFNTNGYVTTGTCSLHVTGGGGHVWWYMENIKRIALDSGIQVMKYMVSASPAGNGPLNVDYVILKYLGPVSAKYPDQHFTASNGLSISKIARRLNGGVGVDFVSTNAHPVRVEQFDARGALLSSEMVSKVTVGKNEVVVGENNALSGVVLIRLSQGSMRTEGKTYLVH
jgi:hypothetical protein